MGKDRLNCSLTGIECNNTKIGKCGTCPTAQNKVLTKLNERQRVSGTSGVTIIDSSGSECTGRILSPNGLEAMIKVSKGKVRTTPPDFDI